MEEKNSCLPAGTLLQGGKYRIVRFIDSGGFGCTYEARHVMLDSRVAVKEFFVKDFCNRDETTSRVTVGTTGRRGLVDKLRRKFVDEAKALYALQHPGIVHVSDVFEENGTAYFVMDYIDGPSLGDLVKRRGPLPEAEALRYIRQVCSALAYVHDHNRLHLDIKPANIMVDGGGRAVLVDFGASKQYDEADGQNTSTLLGKTPGYAPLEQMGNDVACFLPATDLYALGATLYKLLTGVTPPNATRLASGEDLPPLPASVGAATRAAVAAAMVGNKAKRTQSVAEFLAVLDGGDAGEVDVTVVEEGGGTAGKPRKRGGGAGAGKRKTSEPGNGRNTGGRKNPKPNEDEEAAPVSPEPASRAVKHYGLWLSVCVAAIAAVWYFWKADSDSVDSRQNQAAVSTSVSSSSASKISGCGKIAGHDYVDLGLSVKWAAYNVGASSPSEYGDYYAWGETVPKSKYVAENSHTYKKKFRDIGGDFRYDAAHANWGSTWRLPTKKECEELKDNCTWTWTTLNGRKGYEVTGKNGNSIFLPAAGWRRGTSLYRAGEYGYYWSSTPYEGNPGRAYNLIFYSGCRYVDWYYRYGGFSVRPVSE